MRVSEFQIFSLMIANLQRSREQMLDSQEQISTGKRVNRASDDPVSYNRIVLHRAAGAVTDQRLRNVDFGTQRLNAADSTLSSVTNIIGRLEELSVQMNSDTLGPAERDAGYNEVKQLVLQLQSAANTTVNGQPLFGGAATHGRATGLALTTPVALTNGSNDTLTVTVDGVTSGSIDLTAGAESLSGAQLAARVQSRINADSALVAAGKSVTVTFDTDHLVIASNTAGSGSSAAAVGGTSLSSLGFNGGSVTSGASPYAYRAVTSVAAGNTGGVTIGQGAVTDPNKVTLNDYVVKFRSPTAFDVYNVSTPVVVAAASTNAGGAIETDAGVRDSNAVTLDSYRLDFTSATQFTITDTTTGTVVSAGNAYTSGGNIDFAGLRVVLTNGSSGGPKTGDSFTVSPQPKVVLANQTYVSGAAVAFDGVQITMRDGSGPPAANDLVRVQTGIQYQGDGGVQTIEVGDQQTVKTNLPGSQVFSGPSLDLFTSLKSFSASLTGHYGAGLTQGIADIGAAKDQIGKAQGEVGALSNRLTTDQAALQDAKSLVQSSLSQEQDADVVQAISDLSMQQVAMQASAQAASQIFQTSLLNFLK